MAVSQQDRLSAPRSHAPAPAKPAWISSLYVVVGQYPKGPKYLTIGYIGFLFAGIVIKVLSRYLIVGQFLGPLQIVYTMIYIIAMTLPEPVVWKSPSALEP